MEIFLAVSAILYTLLEDNNSNGMMQQIINAGMEILFTISKKTAINIMPSDSNNKG